MKKLILLLLFIPVVFSCDKEGNDPLIYSIEVTIQLQGKLLVEKMGLEPTTS